MQLRMMLIVALMTLALVISGCAEDAGAGDPTATVEQYLQALITADADGLAAVMCADLESTVEIQAQTFETVTDAEIQDLACTFDADSNTVSCDGQIVAAYGLQESTFPLATYSVTQEAGEWKWCGEA